MLDDLIGVAQSYITYLR